MNNKLVTDYVVKSIADDYKLRIERELREAGLADEIESVNITFHFR